MISMKGVFVTGTGTGVGKTLVSAGLAWALRKRNVDVAATKPFATGKKVYSSKYKSHDTAMLAEASGATESDEELNPFFFKVPAAPLMAAQVLKKPAADVHGALFPLKKLGIKHGFVVVEGIGGIMVPLTESEFVADFARLLGLPVVIVTTPKLGTMNHTLLTVRVCREFGLDIAGLIVNMMPQKPDAVEKNTPQMLQRLASVPLLATVPLMKKPNYKQAAGALERQGAVDRILG
ncbi:MAG: dethiobiotin synthase [Nitrososphaera sp.]|uniref:dethiobiotin synthase n=1 Tax=Nitrososphaera sp. TaxID=1971748 RepID=UPI0017F1422C|nr:dethiobiotin synthase [Nitrososphaera sp.]NWG37631.1 dethiobiotin synthase [Nitrososphaera sp.]